MRARILATLLVLVAALFVAQPASASTQLAFGLYDGPIAHYSWGLDGMPSPQIVVSYLAWGESFGDKTDFYQVAYKHGAEPFVELGSTGCTWLCGSATPVNPSLESITAGRYDNYLTSFARAVAAYGHPVLLTFDHEMNGTWYPWGAENYSPSAWVQAWRHVYSVIKPIAGNAVFVWAPNTQYGAAPVAPYWPGAAYTDETGLDCYLASASQTFASQCGSTVAAIRSLTSDPMLLSETGIEPDGHRPSQIGPLVQAVKDAGMTGLVWFDRDNSYLHRPGQAAMRRALG